MLPNFFAAVPREDRSADIFFQRQEFALAFPESRRFGRPSGQIFQQIHKVAPNYGFFV